MYTFNIKLMEIYNTYYSNITQISMSNGIFFSKLKKFSFCRVASVFSSLLYTIFDVIQLSRFMLVIDRGHWRSRGQKIGLSHESLNHHSSIWLTFEIFGSIEPTVIALSAAWRKIELFIKLSITTLFSVRFSIILAL